jgi:hypothetical protein
VSAPTLVVDAAVADVERPVVAALARQLGDCVAHASGDPWRVDARVHDGVDALAPGDGAHIVVASLQTELAGHDDAASVSARWSAKLGALTPRASAVLLLTIVRRVDAPLPARLHGEAPVIERIRRLDRCAIELSHACGAAVADVDRVFAHFGTRQLLCDHRLQGPVAAEAAAWTILATLVSLGTLDDYAGPGATERARTWLGSLAELPRFVQKRLAAR